MASSGGKRAPIDRTQHVFIGEDRPTHIDAKQVDGTTPQSMTGWSLVWELLDHEGGTVQFDYTTAAGEITIEDGDGTDDRATFTITDADLEALPGAGTYWHVLRRNDAGNEGQIAFGPAEIFAGSI